MSNIDELIKQVADLQQNVTGLKVVQGGHDEALDTIWMLLASCLVFFMHAGFSLLESGSVRFKNTQNILAKNLIVVCVGFLMWYICGWAFAYGPVDEPNKFSGAVGFFGAGFYEDQSMFRQWFFQGAFCATGATIVSGAMAERTQIKGFGIYTTLMAGLIYPIVVYWGWSGSGAFSYANDEGKTVSFIGNAGYKDFAGSGLVHMVGGVGAIIGAIIVGARKDRFDSAVEEDFTAHSVPFCVLGTFCLWFGWYGFNPGSTLAMHDAETAYIAGLVAMNTTLAPCVAGLIVFGLRAKVVQPKLLDVGGFCNGILAGLVAITAGCAFVEPWESIIIGIVGAFVYQGASMLLVKLKIDDVVDAFPVHCCCGFWGVIATGLFGDPEMEFGGNGAFYGGDQLGIQIVACICIALWVGALSVMILLPLKLLGMLRLSDDFQDQGADVVEHSPSKAYSEPTGGSSANVAV